MRWEANRTWQGKLSLADVRDAIDRQALAGKWEVLAWHENGAVCEFRCSRLQVRQAIGAIGKIVEDEAFAGEGRPSEVGRDRD